MLIGSPKKVVDHSAMARERSELVVDRDPRKWKTSDVLPDGRFLVTTWNGGTRVVASDGSVVEPSSWEAAALRSLLVMSFPTKRGLAALSDARDENDETLD